MKGDKTMKKENELKVKKNVNYEIEIDGYMISFDAKGKLDILAFPKDKKNSPKRLWLTFDDIKKIAD